ncbi:NlpC/P60 family protein [Thermopolyspora sp. NPDC052614]|uniref:C40 family peptidase n=1 Tax=Thermopolyspora sp. NPDC052614 TaxID=3155682 RepID=UPI003414C96B
MTVLLVTQGGLQGDAIADPRPTIAQAKARLAKLEDKADQAVERYNEANESWKKKRKKYQELNADFKRQQERVLAMRSSIVGLAVTAYQGADALAMPGIAGGGDPLMTLNGLATLSQISKVRSEAMSGYEAEVKDLGARRDRAKTAFEEAADDREKFRKKRDEVEKLVTEQERLLRRLGTYNAGNTNSTGLKYTGPASGNARTALQFAYSQIGKPYRYGGTGPGVWDCSGLTQAAWRAAGVELPRTTTQQWAWGANRRVSMDDLQPGDLLFSNGLGHVGVYAGDGKMVHAPRTGDVVKVVTLSSYGMGRFVGAVRP